jgi:hypothetical protein
MKSVLGAVATGSGSRTVDGATRSLIAPGTDLTDS